MSSMILCRRVLLLLIAWPSSAEGRCLCCRGDHSTDEEGFCKWWSAKHDKVEKLGMEAIEIEASQESRRLFIAYFRTHARLEDPIMWDLFRECPAFDAVKHEPLLYTNEQEENEIRQGLSMLANKIHGHQEGDSKAWSVSSESQVVQESCSGNASVTLLEGIDQDWALLRAKVAAHTSSEERLLKHSGLLEACEEHLDRRWTEIMEETHQDAQILYDEFRKMDLSLAQILKFVRGMVADWPAFPELRQRTALRMRQVRHQMSQMLDSDNGNDLLAQLTFTAVVEYVRWIQLEQSEGLTIDIWDEVCFHFGLLPRVLAAHCALASATFAFTALAVSALVKLILKGSSRKGRAL